MSEKLFLSTEDESFTFSFKYYMNSTSKDKYLIGMRKFFCFLMDMSCVCAPSPFVFKHQLSKQTCATRKRPPLWCVTMAQVWWRPALPGMTLPGLCFPPLWADPAIRWDDNVHLRNLGLSLIFDPISKTPLKSQYLRFDLWPVKATLC